MMNVLFIPYTSNPYQRLLANSLTEMEVNVTFKKSLSLLFVLKTIFKKDVDVLHIHWQHPLLLSNKKLITFFKSFYFIFKLILFKLFRIRIVWTVHNIVNLEGSFEDIELFFNRIIANLSDKMIVHCINAKKEVMKSYKAKEQQIVVIPHGNYINYYENTISKTQSRTNLQLGKQDFVFLYLGKIRLYRGIFDLIESFNKLESSDAKLLIAGAPRHQSKISGEVYKKIKRSDNIQAMLTFIEDKEIQTYVNAADVIVYACNPFFFSPTQMPGGVILALTFGKPVIAPEIGCIPDVLRRNKYSDSLLYNPYKNNGLTEALKYTLKIPTKHMSKLGKLNYKIASQLQWNKIAERTYKVYQE